MAAVRSAQPWLDALISGRAAFGGPFAAAAFSGQGFFHQLDRLTHLLDVGGVEAEIFVHTILDQSHGFTDLVGGVAQSSHWFEGWKQFDLVNDTQLSPES